MREQKRPITQLWDFTPTVAGDSSQINSAPPPDTQVLKRIRVDQPKLPPSDPKPYPKDDSIPKLGNKKIEAPPPHTQVLKRVRVDQPKLPPSDPKPYPKDETSTPKFGNKNIEQPTGATLQAHYDEFMALDQAGPAMIGSDNKEEPSLVAIKRMKKANKNPVNRIKSFTSDHLVQIKNMFEDGDDIVIIYETMDVTLRQLTGILRGPLKAFQIAAICKEVSQLRSGYLEIAHCHETGTGRSLIPA